MRFGTKGIIVKEGRILIIKRSGYDTYRAGEWDLPGGRLDCNEGIFDGHKREVLEETGISVEILCPLRMWNAQRPDGEIAGLTLLSRHISGEVVLSSEHTEHMWAAPREIQLLDAPAWIKEDALRAAEINPSLFAKDL